jgi:hypothetical protein
MGIKIGTFKEKLEIKIGSKLMGYPNTETRFCKGTTGDIEANGIILEDEKNKGCLISLDILGIELPFTNKVREEIEKRFNIPFDNIMLCCIHTLYGGDGNVAGVYIDDIEIEIYPKK